MKTKTKFAMMFLLFTVVASTVAAYGAQSKNIPESRAIFAEETTTTSVPPVTTTTTTTTTATTTKITTVATSTTTETVTTTVTTEAPEKFVLTDEEVAKFMHDYYVECGYSEAQVAGIIGNAEVESGLDPSRAINIYDGGFGLFQLFDCPQRQARFSEYRKQDVGQYLFAQYWGDGCSRFDSREDFESFMRITLDYTFNPDDTAWQTELYGANSPEEAAEVFLVHYERAVGGQGTIEYYAPSAGQLYQGVNSRRESARKWYEYFASEH